MFFNYCKKKIIHGIALFLPLDSCPNVLAFRLLSKNKLLNYFFFHHVKPIQLGENSFPFMSLVVPRIHETLLRAVWLFNVHGVF
jgi:hypothetical protein